MPGRRVVVVPVMLSLRVLESPGSDTVCPRLSLKISDVLVHPEKELLWGFYLALLCNLLFHLCYVPFYVLKHHPQDSDFTSPALLVGPCLIHLYAWVSTKCNAWPLDIAIKCLLNGCLHSKAFRYSAWGLRNQVMMLANTISREMALSKTILLYFSYYLSSHENPECT